MTVIRASRTAQIPANTCYRRPGGVPVRSISLSAFVAVFLSLATASTAWAGFFDDLLEGAEDVVEDTTDYIEEKVEGEAKDGVDDVFEGEQPEAQQPAEQPQTTPPQTAAPEQPSVSQPSPSSAGGQSQVEMAMEVQDRLNQLGYNAGPVDGLPGAKTVSAIAAFQRDQGLVEDGKITAALVEALRTAATSSQVAPNITAETPASPTGTNSAETTGPQRSVAAQTSHELTPCEVRTATSTQNQGQLRCTHCPKSGNLLPPDLTRRGPWRATFDVGKHSSERVLQVEAADTRAEKRVSAYLKGHFFSYPDQEQISGVICKWQPDAQQGQPAQSSGDATPVGAMSAAELTREAQERLNALGYDAGPAKGVSGPKTALAIAAFQRDQGLPEDGVVSAALIEALRTASSSSQGVASIAAETPAAPSSNSLVRAFGPWTEVLGMSVGEARAFSETLEGSRTVDRCSYIINNSKSAGTFMFGPKDSVGCPDDNVPVQFASFDGALQIGSWSRFRRS